MSNKPQRELGPRKMSTGAKIAIGVFAVIMALSMTLPSLTQIFAGASAASSSSSEASDQEAQTDDAEAKKEEEGKDDQKESDKDASKEQEKKDDTTANVPNNETLKNLADQNKDEVQKYEERLKNNPDNMAATLHLGQTYMNWGYSAISSSTTDEETNYSKALLNKAIGYFDSYLKKNPDSKAAQVQRTLCDYYLGSTDEAIKKLEDMTKKDPDFALGWAYLGMLKEQQYDSKAALDAYLKAVEADPNDEYGVQSYAKERMESINESLGTVDKMANNSEKPSGQAAPTEGLPGVIAKSQDE